MSLTKKHRDALAYIAKHGHAVLGDDDSLTERVLDTLEREGLVDLDAAAGQYVLTDAGREAATPAPRALGPHQQRTAKTGAQHIQGWAADLEKAITQNDVETAAKLAGAIADQIARTTKVITAAKPTAKEQGR